MSEKTVNILLVEDNETDVKIILRAFEKAKFNCKVFAVEDGKEALDFVQNQGKYQDKDKFCLPNAILLDVNMPRMDGHTFVRELKKFERFKSIPLIVFTTKEGMEDLFRIEGVDSYVVKSIDATDLIKRIKNLLGLP